MVGVRGGGGAADLPEWYMPPRMIGGYVTGPVLIGRSDECVVAVRQVLAYPVGGEFGVEAHACGSALEDGAQPGVSVVAAAALSCALRRRTGSGSG